MPHNLNHTLITMKTTQHDKNDSKKNKIHKTNNCNTPKEQPQIRI